MHPQTEDAWQAARLLELEQFRHPEDRDRLNEIRALALEQVRDDTPEVEPERAGRSGRVNPRPDVGESLYGSRWTPQQQAIEQAMIPFLDRLSRQQREVIHLRYWGRLSVRQTAMVMGIKAGSVQVHESRALAALKAALTESFTQEES